MIKINNIQYYTVTYPDHTKSFHIEKDKSSVMDDNDKIIFVWSYNSENELLDLVYLVNTVRQCYPNNPLFLQMPYIPNARMDRIYEDSESFTLKYFASIINSLDFKKVIVVDAHSPVSMALINNVVDANKSVIKLLVKKVQDLYPPDQKFNIMFPDAGAQKRYHTILKETMDTSNFLYAVGNKVRDWNTGKITSYNIETNDYYEGSKYPVIIIDDICSYGGTFVSAAKALDTNYPCNKYLCVTHCEPSIFNGEVFSCGLIHKVFTTNSIEYFDDSKIFPDNNYNFDNSIDVCDPTLFI